MRPEIERGSLRFHLSAFDVIALLLQLLRAACFHGVVVVQGDRIACDVLLLGFFAHLFSYQRRLRRLLSLHAHRNIPASPFGSSFRFRREVQPTWSRVSLPTVLASLWGNLS